MNPTDMTNSEIESWFAERGIDATVVDRCPATGCKACLPADLPAAA
jgi:hypothetical protein